MTLWVTRVALWVKAAAAQRAPLLTLTLEKLLRCLLRSRSVKLCFHLHMVTSEGHFVGSSSAVRPLSTSMERRLRRGRGPSSRGGARRLGALPR